MKKWLLAWAAAELMLARLARLCSSPALPNPGPLLESIVIPDADPPEEMELFAVPTGVNNRVAAYAYRGASILDRRDFYAIGGSPIVGLTPWPHIDAIVGSPGRHTCRLDEWRRR